jgi:DNA-directed RNA polymerase specialized sigma24 family protein
MSHKDAEWIRKARDGDVEAVRELIENRYADVYRFCRCLLHSQADAEAATRQVLGLALTGGGVDSTIDGIAMEVCRSWMDRRRHVSLPPDEHGTGDRHAPAATESDDARLAAALDRLPVDHRIPLLHRCLSGLGADESCRLLGTSEKILNVRLENARLRVAEDTGLDPDAVEDSVRDLLAAMPVPEQHRTTVLEEALGPQEKANTGAAVITAVLAALAFIVAVVLFAAKQGG